MNKNKKGRKKVIPSYFQKSGDSLSSILQAGSYKRKLKQVLQKNKEFAKENQTLKVDLAHSTKSLQRCTSYNAHILLAKKKLDALVGIAQTFVAGLKEIANFLDMKEFLFMTSTDEEWRKLKLPPQALEPIDEINSSVTEEVDLRSMSRETTPVVEPQRTPVTRTSKTPVTRSSKSPVIKTSKSPVTRNSKSPVTGTSKTPIINLPETPKVADTSSTSSLGTPVLCLSPLPVKRPLASIGGVQEARPPKRSKTPEKAVKNPSPKTRKSLLDQKPKPFKKSPAKTPPSPLKKSPKLSKIPTRQKNALPEPSIAFLPLSPPASRKTFVVRKEDNSSDNVISSRLRRETFKVPQIPISDDIENTANVPSPRRETGSNDGPITSGHTLMPNTNQSDDMEITTMLPLGQPLAFNPCPLPPSDEMELTAVLPVQCFISAQSSAVPFTQVEPSHVIPEKTVVLTSKEVAEATGNPLARKKSLRVKKSMGVRHADSEADENRQPSTKRMSFDDTTFNARRKSVQFSLNECYNAFQNMKTKSDPPKSILKQPTQDPEPSKCKTPEPQRDGKSEVPKAPLGCINFSSSDDSTLTPKLPAELFTEKCPQVKRNFSGVSERRSKKKTISGGDVFNEIQAFEETGPSCFVPVVQDNRRKSPQKTSESSKKKNDSAELKNATSSKDAINEIETESEPDSFVVSLPKTGRKSLLKTSSSIKKKVEYAESEEPTSSKGVLNEVEVSKLTDSDSNVPPAPKCAKKPVLKTAASSKKKKESAQIEEPTCSKNVLSETEVSEETEKDCILPPVSKSRKKSQTKTSTSNKKKKSTELEEAKASALSHNVDSKVPPAEPKRVRVKKSKSKTQEDLEKVEVDILTDPERSASFGRVRRHTAAKSYKEPSLNCKMRRE